MGLSDLPSGEIKDLDPARVPTMSMEEIDSGRYEETPSKPSEGLDGLSSEQLKSLMDEYKGIMREMNPNADGTNLEYNKGLEEMPRRNGRL